MPTCFYLLQVTRLLPDAVGTTCGQRLEKVIGTEHTDIIRVPFRNENGILGKWISCFDVWPYLEILICHYMCVRVQNPRGMAGKWAACGKSSMVRQGSDMVAVGKQA